MNKKFIEFLLEAKKNTYATNGEKKEKILDSGAKQLIFAKEKYLYVDSYYGSKDFVGEEIVFENKKFIWGMNYSGKMINIVPKKEFFEFLKDTLKLVPKEIPFRGPISFERKEFKYNNIVKEKNLEKFVGKEEIYYKNKLVYSLEYHGGKIENWWNKLEFITTTKPLKARVKQRYADFIVEEIYENNLNDEYKCLVQRFNVSFEERKPFEKMVVPENTEKKEHLILELEKINTDTNKAIAMIARGLGVSTKRIGYAGLKDKRAITCQRISVFEPIIEKIIGFGMKGLELRNPVWGERLELGDLKGNFFTITLRNISEKEEEIKKIVLEFTKQIGKGVPNFFGTQRFGGKRMITHKVGKLLIKEHYKEAILLYLTETFEEEKEDIKNARINLAKTLDYKQALKEFPRECRTELAIINQLVRNENDFIGALNALPKKTRYLFVHAYQSYLFNKILEKRIELFGEKALQKVDEEECNEEGIPLGALFGFESEFTKGRIGEIEKKLFEEEDISFEDFKIRAQSELSSKGSKKEIVLFPKNFLLKRIFDDEYNEGKKAVEIEFFLSKGNYATTILKELIKEEIFWRQKIKTQNFNKQKK